jgi:hypothetical protein
VDSGAALQQQLPNKDSKFDTVGMGRSNVMPTPGAIGELLSSLLLRGKYEKATPRPYRAMCTVAAALLIVTQSSSLIIGTVAYML